MFNLSEIEHTLRMPPHLLNLPLQEAVKKELEHLFLDKVIPKLGLCISVYDIKSIDGGFIQPGDGAATYVVSFRLLMFRPFVGEIIVSKLKESNENGLQLSLGFFDDIYVPLHLMPSPIRSEPDPNNPKGIMWVWEYEGRDLKIDGVDEIWFRVHSINYPAPPIQLELEKLDLSNPNENKKVEQPKPFAPMVIHAFLDRDGLGPCTWWSGAVLVPSESSL